MLLTRNSDEPLYSQLAALIAGQIDSGVYRPGQRIPSVRRLSQQHDLSLTTVVDACRLLESRDVIVSRPRSGYFVQRPRTAIPPASDPTALLTRSSRIDAPLSLRVNLGIGSPQQPTLGAAVQGPELMAVSALNRLVSQTMRLRPTESHSYDSPPGNPALRRAIAQRGGDAGYSVSPDEVVITSGAKEAVYLSIRTVTRPGDTVAIESPAYYALLEVLASLDLSVIEVPSHPETGIDLDALATVLEEHHIAALALVSNFSNPSGACMTDEAKARLVALLDRHEVPLVEDDVYGYLNFEGARPKAIKAFDTQGRVLYCGSFSKTVSPGLRVGWAIPGRYQHAFEHLKLVVNQSSATAPQLAIASFLDSGGFEHHVRRIRRAYREQMDAVVAAVDAYFPATTRHTAPRGGHVLWIQIPGLDSLALYERVSPSGIHIAPGPLFSASRGYLDHFRLNTGFPFTADIDRQIRCIGEQIASSQE